jgi:hypothetical protein
MAWPFSADYSSDMMAERLRCLSASPWLDGGIGAAATVTTWIELLGQRARN